MSITFTDHATLPDSTFNDKDTWVIFVKKEPFSNWIGALRYCAELTFAGHNDWRLPNINELETLSDKTQINQFIDTNIFPNTKIDYSNIGLLDAYWSSTTKILPEDGTVGVGRAWVMNYKYEFRTVFDKLPPRTSEIGNYTRCVRTP